jgi:formylglycine-generating enzyme required for sulfatase activity
MVFIGGSDRKPPAGRCGHVPYDYEIGRAEVTNAEYSDFLNAVASRRDTRGLFSPLMAVHFWGGIIRSTHGNEFTYAPKAGYENLPVTFVSYYDAVRFANWLHYGRPQAEAGHDATEGDSRSGSYNTSGRYPTRNPDATYVVPTCDEWAKAAYYDEGTGRYADWVTKGPTISSEAAVPAADGANVSNALGFANPFPHLVPVFSYRASRSGTYNQAGNVMEWVDTRYGNAQRVMGGSLFMNAASTRATYVDSENPDHEIATFGFRIARVKSASKYQRVRGPVADSEFVRIGFAGYPPDPDHFQGYVGYEFEIQRTEITNEQYVEFLNAVAAKSDPANLFKKDMQFGIGGGITRTGHTGAWRYAVKPGWRSRAVNYVSWFSLARLANWRHFGQPVNGESVVGTTEGTDRLGAYDTRHFPYAARQSFDPAKLPAGRNRGARYFIPSDAEWYKAAYFDISKQGADRFWDYPTGADIPPAQGGVGSANYQVGNRLATGEPFFIAEAADFADSPSPMGTVQQGGNLWEWVEDWRSKGEGNCWRCDEWTKGLRGGSFNYTWRGLHAANLDPATPDQAYFVHGGRLARSVDTNGWSPADPPVFSRMMWRVQARARRSSPWQRTGAAVGCFAAGVIVASLGRRKRSG